MEHPLFRLLGLVETDAATIRSLAREHRLDNLEDQR
jgi:hypothetical protein